MQASTSTAATTTTAIAAVESDSECCERVCAYVRAFDVDPVTGLGAAPATVGTEVVGVLAGAPAAGVAGETVVVGVVVGEAPAAPWWTLAVAGTGKLGVEAGWVGVELVSTAIWG
jgi:hypothetical protein